MGSKTILDLTSEAELGIELNWHEVLDIILVEEHVSNNSSLSLTFDWVPGEYDFLQDDLQRIWVRDGSVCNQDRLLGVIIHFNLLALSLTSSENDYLRIREADWHESTSHHLSVMWEVSVVLRFVSMHIIVTEDRTGHEPSEPNVEFKNYLGRNNVLVLFMTLQVEMGYNDLSFMRHEGGEDQILLLTGSF